VQYSKDMHVCIGDASGILMKKLNQWFSVTASLKAEHKIYHNVNYTRHDPWLIPS
jgi:hypothetical protein